MKILGAGFVVIGPVSIGIKFDAGNVSRTRHENLAANMSMDGLKGLFRDGAFQEFLHNSEP